MVMQAGTYYPPSEYANSFIRRDRVRVVADEMRRETEARYICAEEARRLARKGILELRRQRGLDTRPL
ncbi:Uncharacterised protein [uncultured archaeon]|nr:Uncharacterised protein [uncultured archaeon]